MSTSRQPGMLERLLTALEIDKQERDIIVDSIEDWRDANDLARINGAESDYYLKLPVPYRPRNGNLQDLAELLQIKGITPEIYYGHDDKPGLADLLTVRSRGAMININTAPKLILKAIGLSDAEIGNIVQARASQPYPFGAAAVTTRGRFHGDQRHVSDRGGGRDRGRAAREACRPSCSGAIGASAGAAPVAGRLLLAVPPTARHRPRRQEAKG